MPVPVRDVKQFDAADAAKRFAHLQRAGRKTASMDEIMRQRDQTLRAGLDPRDCGDPSRQLALLALGLEDGRELTEAVPATGTASVHGATSWMRAPCWQARSRTPAPDHP